VRFSSDYQPVNRGRKRGSRNKLNHLIDEAAPQILHRVIDQALNGDNASANLLLARAIPPLKPVGAGLEITGNPESFGELATAIISALVKGGDAQAAKDALQALSAASRIYELSDLEDRVRTLEEQEKQEDEKRRERKERKASREAPSCPS
tara:strand:- start:99 stop:551 length:453 start_codon:yes stop_codon:yes gene_type:complete